jgi:hypothetical protein
MELEDNGSITPLRESLVYLRRCHENGDYDDVADRSLLLLNARNGFMQGYEYLKYTPVQEYKDEVVEVFGLYVDSLQKTGHEFASNAPLLDFLAPVMYYEPMTREALKKTAQVDQPLSDFTNTSGVYESLKREATQRSEQFDQTDEGKAMLVKLNEQGDALLAALNDAAYDWNLVVAQFPILKLSSDVYQNLTNTSSTSYLRSCRNEIEVTVALYVDACRKLNRPVTADFPLHQLLPAGTTVVDPAAVPATTKTQEPPADTVSPETPVDVSVEPAAEPAQAETVPVETPSL